MTSQILNLCHIIVNFNKHNHKESLRRWFISPTSSVHLHKSNVVFTLKSARSSRENLAKPNSCRLHWSWPFSFPPESVAFHPFRFPLKLWGFVSRRIVAMESIAIARHGTIGGPALASHRSAPSMSPLSASCTSGLLGSLGNGCCMLRLSHPKSVSAHWRLI